MTKYNISIIDDDPMQLATLTRGLDAVPSLQIRGYESIGTALPIVEKEPPDLLVASFLMPDVDALEALENLQQRGFGAPLLVLTPDSAGAAEHLSEGPLLTIHEAPIELESLRRLIERKLLQASAPLMFSEFQVIDYIQMGYLGHHSFRLEVFLEGGELGTLHMYEGDRAIACVCLIKSALTSLEN